MPRDQHEAFHNKIFFCDVVGYSRMSPPQQRACQIVLNAAVLGALEAVGCSLTRDVIALPTGDGMILNFMAPEPDIHLRAAMLILSDLTSRTVPVEVRIGLNSHVDQWIYDVNGRKNVVGDGINLAQRVMDLGSHGQILMHDRVRQELTSYVDYEGKITFRGNFTVKHAVQVPVAQFHDPAQPYVSSKLIDPQQPAASRAVSFDELFESRILESVLEVRLDGAARAHLRHLQHYVEDFLGRRGALQHLKICVGWIVVELLDAALSWGSVKGDDIVDLKLDVTPNGILISVVQPDVRDFSLGKATRQEGSFFHLMSARGLLCHERRKDGRLELGVELASDLDLTVDIEPCAPTTFQHSRTDYSGGSLGWSQSKADGGLIVHPRGRVDETTWEYFSGQLSGAVDAALADGSTLVVDMSELDYMSSRGLRALTIARRVSAEMVSIVLAAPNARMREVLAISRYDKMFRVVDSVGWNP